MLALKREWWLTQWRAFEDSFEPDLNSAISSPLGVLSASGAIAGGLLVVGYVPPLAAVTGLEQAWIGVLLALLGGSLSWFAWKRRCQGSFGVAATLFDTPFYSAALVYSAATAQPGVGLVFATLHGLMLVGAQAQHYALTPLFAAAVMLPTALLVALLSPPLSTSVALASSVVVALVVSYQTGQRRRLLRAKRQAEAALAVAGRLADDSMHAVLGVVLLDLSHFLHELRNAQTVVRANLTMISEEGTLGELGRASLEDALEAHRMEGELVADTLAKLRSQAGPASEPFPLGPAIEAAVGDRRDRLVVLKDLRTDQFEVRGSASYLEVVLRNLLRNAAQAGATRVWIEATVEGTADAALVRVHDDGPGIPREIRERVFGGFAQSTRPEGSGLGLYLVRRYVELLGGTVALGDGPHGGAEFRIRLPGRSVLADSAQADPVLH